MHSFGIISCFLLGLGGRASGAVLQVPTPVVTEAPSLQKRQDPDAVSLAQILLTAIPESLRQIAATNVPAVSSILWEEFLDDNKPQWFLDLPSDIQDYLIRQFGPQSAWPTATAPVESEFPTWGASSVPAETSQPSGEQSEQPWNTQTQASGSQSATESFDSSASSIETATESSDASSSATSDASASRSLDPSWSQIALPSSSSTSTTDPAPEAANDGGLSKKQKIGIGVGVPFAILGAAAVAFGCCLLLRRRRQKRVDGSLPPSSPGFIPRFAFQEKHADNAELRHPLNRSSSSSFGDLQHMNWDDDVMEPTPVHNQPPFPPPMTTTNHQPIMAPALYHTHSSNRARGKRTSYQSLHSVAEVSEPDEGESPVLSRSSPSKSSPLRQSPKRHSPSRSLVPLPVLATSSPVKRKPVPLYQTGNNNSAADLASQSLLRQTMPEYSETTNTSKDPTNNNTAAFGNYTQLTSNSTPPTNHTNKFPSPNVSPLEERNPRNPFVNPLPTNPYTTYVEDYGPEFHSTVPQSNNGYIDIENGLYGGHTDLSRYPTPSTPKQNHHSRTEWPLRNVVGNGHRRNKSPLWDRVYDG